MPPPRTSSRSFWRSGSAHARPATPRALWPTKAEGPMARRSVATAAAGAAVRAAAGAAAGAAARGAGGANGGMAAGAAAGPAAAAAAEGDQPAAQHGVSCLIRWQCHGMGSWPERSADEAPRPGPADQGVGELASSALSGHRRGGDNGCLWPWPWLGPVASPHAVCSWSTPRRRPREGMAGATCGHEPRHGCDPGAWAGTFAAWMWALLTQCSCLPPWLSRPPDLLSGC
mmetsp:Transcript_54665/g.169253  ORF Transcript_54665/g.169253 Transcript_54665/m.169253 type:complete len:229 (-) Transcript_54665:19-705(-)